MPRALTLAAVALCSGLMSLTPAAYAETKATAKMILDPSVHGLKRLKPLQLGADGDSSKMEPTEYKLKSGQGYRWKIKASDLTEYALVMPEFVRNIWLRKIEVGDPEVEIKVVTFDELEFEDGGEVELFFVAVRPGTYKFGPRGLMERGMVGTITVEGPDKLDIAPMRRGPKKDDDDDK
ncbi:MAG: copper-binding protein [Pseudomonadota bacterium]